MCGPPEDEQDLIFDCPAHSHIRAKHVDLFQLCCTVVDFMSLCEPNAWGGFLDLRDIDCFAYDAYDRCI